jgi:hypothetical protein
MNKLAIVMLAVLMTGCTTATPNYDARFGDAVHDARLGMIVNPDAGKNPEQTVGMDGKAARESIILYQGTYKAPPPVVNVINIGGGLSK